MLKYFLKGTALSLAFGSAAIADECDLDVFEFSKHAEQLISSMHEETTERGYVKPKIETLRRATLKKMAKFSNTYMKPDQIDHLPAISSDTFVNTACNILSSTLNNAIKLDDQFMRIVLNSVFRQHIDPHTRLGVVEPDSDKNNKKTEQDYVFSDIIDEDTGVIKLAEFVESASEEIKIQIAMMEQGDTPPSSYILDLRNNPGGLLEEYAKTSDLFLDEGYVIYTTHDQSEEVVSDFYHKGDVINGKPLAVLINEDSASASEYTASTLQLHKRAIIVGVPSFGKATSYSTRNIGAYALQVTDDTIPLNGGVTTHQGNGTIPDVFASFYRQSSLTKKESDNATMIDLSQFPQQKPATPPIRCNISSDDPIKDCALSRLKYVFP